MRWVHLTTILLAICGIYAEENEDININDVSAPPPKINLDSNLRRALLKALTELENEEKEKTRYSIDDDSKEKIIEKASAASVSIFANGESVTATPTSTTTTGPITSTSSETYNVVFQKSQAVQQQTITTIEKESEDAESILTSASSSFADQTFGKVSQTEKSEKILNQNSIFDNEKSSTKIQKFEPTTIPTTVSTAENEAKVEDVQFFSAPLVAAFTVHQDELGLPKKVEPIFRPPVPTKSPEDIQFEKEQQLNLIKQEQARLAQQEKEKIKLEELKQQQERLQLQQKQKALEDEIFRLNLSLKQQQQFFLKQQEELRVRNNAQSFVPISNPIFTTPAPLNLVQQPPVLSAVSHTFKPQSISLQPSLSFDPLAEAGKLPLNAQFLPVKAPVDFRTPFATQNNNFNRQQAFNQLNSLSQQTPNQVNGFNQNNFNQQSQINNNRFFRQNNGFGNFGTNDFNRNTNSFSIIPAIQQTFDNSAQNTRFFRSNLESTLTAPQFLQPPQVTSVQNNNRFFRSNLESSFGSNNLNQDNRNYQLTNLLYSSGAFRGKSPEDLSLISKVLSLNHLGGRNPGISLRPELQQSFLKNF